MATGGLVSLPKLCTMPATAMPTELILLGVPGLRPQDSHTSTEVHIATTPSTHLHVAGTTWTSQKLSRKRMHTFNKIN